MGTTHVTIRLSDAAWARYSANAEIQGVPLGTYLRSRLERQDEFLESELALRALPPAPATPEPASKGDPPLPPGALLEVILLLRVVAGPQASRMVHAELTRLGLEFWSGGAAPR